MTGVLGLDEEGVADDPSPPKDHPHHLLGFMSLDPESGLHAETASNILKSLWDDVDLSSYPEKPRLFPKAFREIAP